MPENVVIAVNADGTKIGSGTTTIAGAVTITSGTVTATPFKTSSVTTNAAPVTSPGVGAALASIAAPPVGNYEITVTVNVGGTTGAIDFSNVTVTAAGTTTRIANGVGAAITVQWLQALTGAQAIAAQTVAAGTAGSVYGVTLTATQVV
jgi:hypothetical protein